MTNETKTIKGFEFNFICDYFSMMDRQGPGSPEVTLKALSFIDPLTPNSRIADLGCGTGGQTRVLAAHTPGCITGLDLFPDFIRIFNNQAKASGLQDRVKGIVGSMAQLPFEKNELDLIWSGGSIYNIGFERGVNEWRDYLKSGGYIAISESSWFTDKRPAEIEEYWMGLYPEMDTIPHKLAQLQKAGYIPVATFILPETCWTTNFFIPMIRTQELFLEKYKGSKTAEEFVEFQRRDAEIYRTFKDFYGYVFYIAKKIS